MKINILGYTLSIQRRELTPEEVERSGMVEKERECLINITSQNNQLDFLANILDKYTGLEKKEKIEQTQTSIEAAENTLTQWTVQLETIKLWKIKNR